MKYSTLFVFLFLNSITIISFAQPACPAGASAISVLPNQSMYCVGDNMVLQLVPTPPYTIVNPVTWTFAGTANSALITGPQNSIYQINGALTSGLVTASGKLINGGMCNFSKTFMVNVSGLSGLTANAGPDQVYGSSAVTLGPSPCATGGTGPYNYVWSPSTGLSATGSCGPSASPASTTSYTLTVTDTYNGCVVSDEVLVINLNTIISYIVPKRTVDGGFQKPKSNKIYFKFEEEYRSGTLTYKILDYAPSSANVQAPVISCTLLPGTAKTLGDNKYYIDLGSCTGLVSSKFYLVEITNDKAEKFYFKFQY